MKFIEMMSSSQIALAIRTVFIASVKTKNYADMLFILQLNEHTDCSSEINKLLYIKNVLMGSESVHVWNGRIYFLKYL